MINLCLTIPLLMIANIQQTLAWADMWRLENKIIQSFPIAQMAGITSDAVIIYDGPYQGQGLPFFGSTWAISGAINNHFPSIKIPFHHSTYSQDADDYAVRGWHPFLLCGKGASDWNGQHVQQTLRTSIIKLPTHQVWLWQVKQHQLTELKAPQHIQCQHAKGGLYIEKDTHAL